MKVTFTLNGVESDWSGVPLTRLAQALRDDLGLTGTKVGCDAGDCGACTVRLDGKQVCACLVAMGQMQGRAVETVESLAPHGDALASLTASTHTFYRVTAPKTITIIPDTPAKRREYEESIIRTFFLSNADLKETIDLLRIVVDIRQISPTTATNSLGLAARSSRSSTGRTAGLFGDGPGKRRLIASSRNPIMRAARLRPDARPAGR